MINQQQLEYVPVIQIVHAKENARLKLNGITHEASRRNENDTFPVPWTQSEASLRPELLQLRGSDSFLLSTSISFCRFCEPFAVHLWHGNIHSESTRLHYLLRTWPSGNHSKYFPFALPRSVQRLMDSSSTIHGSHESFVHHEKNRMPKVECGPISFRPSTANLRPHLSPVRSVVRGITTLLNIAHHLIGFQCFAV